MLHQTGIGVLGPVFRAYDVRNDRLVAVKVFRLDLLPENVVRVADALRRLTASPMPHPALASLYDVGIEDTSPFLVTSHLSGETLDVWRRRRAPMPFESAMPVLRPLAEAIDAAADAGLRHGALHPRDVFISDDERLAGVTGFGIVDALAAAGVEHTVARRPYVALERAGGEWDVRADVYSLGVLAHEIFTGRRPAGGGEQDGVFTRGLTPDQRVQLRRILAQALADAPGRRFDRASAFVAALDDASRRSGRTTPHRAAVAPAVPVVLPVFAETDPDLDLVQTPVDVEAGASEPARDRAPEQVLDSPFEPEPQDVFPTDGEPDVERVADHAPADAIALSAARDRRTPAADPADPEIVLDDVAIPPSAPFVLAAARPPAVARRSWPATGMFAAAGLAVGIFGAVFVAGTWFAAGEAPAPAAIGAAVDDIAARDDASEPVDADPDDAVAPAQPEAARAAADSASTSPDRDARQAVVRPGRLVVRSDPAGALVTMGGRLLGETPVVLHDLPLGTHDVRVAHPGHVPRTERVTLAASSPTRTLSVTLQPGLPPTTSTRGAIDVDSRPRGARVLIDGRFVGHAPLRVAEIAAGEHQITLELGGYHSATGRVQVEPGRAQPLRVTLRAAQ